MVVEGLLADRETRAPVVAKAKPRCPTFAEIGLKWTSNELANEFKHNVRRIDQQDNATRLELHVYPVRYQPSVAHEDTTYLGCKVGDIPMDGFTVEQRGLRDESSG